MEFYMFEKYDEANNLKRTKILLNLLLRRLYKHYSLFNTTNSEFFEEKKGLSIVLKTMNNELFTISKVTNIVKSFFQVIYLVCKIIS